MLPVDVRERVELLSDGWIDAASLELAEDDLSELRAAIERTGAGHGPVAPA